MEHDRSLESRIDALESRCRRLRLWCLASSAGLLGACLTGAVASAPKVLRAERFELLAPDGRTAGSWWADERNAVMEMTAASGDWSVVLVAGEGEITEGKTVVSFSENSEGTGEEVESEFQAEQTRSIPFVGLTVSNAAGETQPRTIVHVGTGLQEDTPGIQVSRGATEAWLQARDDGALLHMEGGDTVFGALNAFALEQGSGLSVCWNDERAANLAATSEETGLAIHGDLESTYGEEDPPPTIELLVDEQQTGHARIRDGDRVVFEAP